jgi:enoyl-CoA hydratase/carnithine racemase
MSSRVLSEQDLLEFTVEGHIATVAFNRPGVLNAVSTPVFRRLIDVFDEINESGAIWCVILKGNGRAFCVGADHKERPGMTHDEVRRRRWISPQAFSAMRRCLRPVIAQVHGYALGSGLEMALGCDFIVAAAGTVMGLVETTRGSIPAGGGTQLLPRLIGVARAKELIFTGRKFTAEDALAWGMVNYVVPEAELAATVMKLATEIAAAAPISNVQAKKAVNASLDLDLANGMAVEAALYERVLTSHDRAEFLQASREHRRPVFKGE